MNTYFYYCEYKKDGKNAGTDGIVNDDNAFNDESLAIYRKLAMKDVGADKGTFIFKSFSKISG
jgi:hypothetical protein